MAIERSLDALFCTRKLTASSYIGASVVCKKQNGLHRLITHVVGNKNGTESLLCNVYPKMYVYLKPCSAFVLILIVPSNPMTPTCFTRGQVLQEFPPLRQQISYPNCTGQNIV